MGCTIKPDEIKRVKGLGFLNNKGTDLFNGRVITVNGKITAEQAKVIAEAAEKFGNGDVEFTTRLTVEVRGIHFDNIEPFREYIAKAGLETGGTGSLVRPVVLPASTACMTPLIYLKKSMRGSTKATIPLSCPTNLRLQPAAAPTTA